MRIVAAVILGIGLLTLPAARAETVRIAIGEWKPFISKDLPNYGPHTEIVTTALAAAGFDVEYDFLPWKRAYNRTRAGDYVATFSWFKTKSRAEEVLYPETPVAVRETAIFYNKKRFPDGLEVTSLENIVERGLTVIGAIGYWYMEDLEKMGAEIHPISDARLAWRMLALERADLYIEDTAVAERQIHETLDKEAARHIAQGNVLRRAPMYIVFTKNNPIGPRLRDAWDAHAPQP